MHPQHEHWDLDPFAKKVIRERADWLIGLECGFGPEDQELSRARTGPTGHVLLDVVGRTLVVGPRSSISKPSPSTNSRPDLSST